MRQTDRETHGLSLTPKGRSLLTYLSPSIDSLDKSSNDESLAHLTMRQESSNCAPCLRAWDTWYIYLLGIQVDSCIYNSLM